MKLKVFSNPNKDIAENIKQAIKDSDGYCPCSLERNNDTRCMCKAFREQKTQGYCHCGLFYKELSQD